VNFLAKYIDIYKEDCMTTVSGPLGEQPIGTIKRRVISEPTITSVKLGGKLQVTKPHDKIVQNFNISGQRVQLTNNDYLQITLPDNRIICLATDHSGAYYLTLKFHKEGLISGDERFVHVDQREHHDCFDLNSELPPLTARLEKHLQGCARTAQNQANKRLSVDQTNYVRALKQQFPRMEFLFLHDGNFEALSRVAELSWSKRVALFTTRVNIEHRPDLVPILNQNDIASVDLDIFDMVRSKDKIVNQLAGIVRPCKIIMLFTSPEYIASATAVSLAEQLVGELS